MRKITLRRDGKKIDLEITMYQMGNILAQGSDGEQYIRNGKNGKWKKAYFTAK
jgi:hypothetical protein